VRRRGADPLVGAALAAAGRDRPSVAYVGAASGDNAVFRTMISGLLKKAGAGQVRLAPLCGARGDPAKARRVLQESDVIFMSGGDVDAGMRVLDESRITGLLVELRAQGKAFFGVSAGSIMLARSWVRWADPDDDATAELFPCLDFAPVYCDTHGEGEGWEELQALQSLAPAGAVSYGITSGAALLVQEGGEVSALGGEVHRFCRKGRTVIRMESLLPA
jgi:peptidase E